VAAKETYPGPAGALEMYERLVEGHPEAERKGAKIPYTSRNGHMYSFLASDGVMALRLPDELREEFLAEYGTDPVEQYGRVMAEYVAVPEELLDDTSGLLTWFERSHDWIGTLKPKPTRR
jgi:hypothetical protein